jgi:hypothetical protein
LYHTVISLEEDPMLSPNPRDALLPNPLSWTSPTRTWSSEPPTMELWDAWVFAEVDSELTLRRWWDASPEERSAAFSAYGAALDREEQAAAVLAERLGDNSAS